MYDSRVDHAIMVNYLLRLESTRQACVNWLIITFRKEIDILLNQRIHDSKNDFLVLHLRFNLFRQVLIYYCVYPLSFQTEFLKHRHLVIDEQVGLWSQKLLNDYNIAFGARDYDFELVKRSVES